MSPLNSSNSSNISKGRNLQADIQDDGAIDFLGLLDVLIDARWLIISIVFLVSLLGQRLFKPLGV
jgi:hypothetical protein